MSFLFYIIKFITILSVLAKYYQGEFDKGVFEHDELENDKLLVGEM